MHASRWLLAALFAAGFAVACVGVTVASARNQTWLVVGDLHIDPFDRSARPAPAGRDGNFALLESAVSAMRAASARPDLVVVAGDTLAHHFAALARRHGAPADDAGIATMRAVAARFGAAFPGSQFALILGNNDAPCGDYRSDFGGRFLLESATAWAPLVARRGGGISVRRFTASLLQNGSYVVRLAQRRLRLIVLDTVPMSAVYRGTCSGRRIGAAAQQLSWLQRTLAATPPGMRNVVAMHVPPGYDAISTALTRGFLAVPYLDRSSSRALIGAQIAARHRVAFSLAAHAHRFDVRVFDGAVTLVAGALSPIYGNRPTFYRLTIAPDGTLLDIAAYAYDAATRRWQAHDFDSKWAVRSLDAASLSKLHQRLQRDPAMRGEWGAASVGWAPAASVPLEPWRGSLWRVAWCAQAVAGDQFRRCAEIVGRTRTSIVVAVAIAVLALLGLGVTVAAIVRKVPFRGRRNLVKL